jgi:hypothetical protein
MAELVVGGTCYTLAPLRYRQVSKVFPGLADHPLDRGEGILLAVAYSLMNGGAFEGESVESVADSIDEGASPTEVTRAYMDILTLTGMQKHSTAEEIAADPENQKPLEELKAELAAIKAEIEKRAIASANKSHLVEPVSD